MLLQLGRHVDVSMKSLVFKFSLRFPAYHFRHPCFQGQPKLAPYLCLAQEDLNYEPLHSTHHHAQSRNPSISHHLMYI